jgi:hypothetical protein
MKDDKDLWSDLLADADGFREATLHRTLNRARRRRVMRRVGQMTAVALAVGIGAWLWRPQTPRVITRLPQPKITRLEVVSSAPLRMDMVVRSGQSTVRMVESSPLQIAVVETSRAGGLFRELSDDELLAVVPGKPAVLVRRGPHEAELLMVDATVKSVDSAGQTEEPLKIPVRNTN